MSAAPPAATASGARSLSLVNQGPGGGIGGGGASSAGSKVEEALSEEQRIAAMFANQDSQWEQEQEKMAQ
jgi:hypothetical protein